MTKHTRATATLVAIAMALSLANSDAQAHAKVVETLPKANSTVASPNTIEVHFDEAIEVKLSSMKLTLSSGTEIGVMSMTNAKEPTTLSIMPNSTLKPGTYKVSWSTVSDDGHKEQGTFSFTVK